MGNILLAVVSGFGACMSLIVSIGAQNAFVLRQGLRRHAVPAVVAVCIASDVVLIVVGVAGFGSAIRAVPAGLLAVGLVGGGFLLWQGFLAARRAFRPSTLEVDNVAVGSPRRAVLTCLSVTWLNPQAYLETVVVIGSLAAGHGPLRWEFGLGAVLASICWFFGLGFGARLLRGLFARPVSWRILDGLIAATMATLGVTLLTNA
jgi:L-lysine exporter family protein LysE/ArgO